VCKKITMKGEDMSGKSILHCVLVALIVSMLMPALVVTPAQASDGPTNWAIVISGGANYWNNHARYWNDLSEMYEILTDTYGYDEDNVFVLYADGDPPVADPDALDPDEDPLPPPPYDGNCWDAANAHAYYPTDIIDYAATSANIDTVTDLIAASGHCGDTLFVFVTDHGGGGGTINLWGESISSATFASHMNDITKYLWRAFEMEQCFSGEMIPDLSDPNTAIATAAGDTTSCGAGSSLFYYDPFVYYFNAALKGEFPSPAGGGSVDPSSHSSSNVGDADADSDGKVSFVEAYNYAYPLSWCDEDEQYDDNGDGVSQETGPMPAGGDGPLGALIFLGEQTDNPIADAGDNQIVEQAYYQGADVTLDGSGSSDPGGAPLSYSWTWVGGSASGVNPTISLPLGTTTVTLVVDNGILQSSCPDTVNITVVDTTPPEVDAGVDITVEQTSYQGATADLPDPVVTDICDPDPDVVIEGVMPIYPLGCTEVTVTATDDSGNVAIDTVWVCVVDTTPPEVACIESVNPSGKKTPPAGNTTLPGSKGGQNEDGFYQLLAEDICDPEPMIYVVDTGSGAVFGPFVSGDVIKYTEDPDAMPDMKKMGSDKGQAGAVFRHIIGNGDACVTAVDFSGNAAACVSCLVPPLPK